MPNDTRSTVTVYQMHLIPSPSQDHVDPGQDKLEFAPRNLADPLVQLNLVERHDARRIGDRIPIQPARRRSQQHVARRVGPFEIAGQRHAHHRRDSALVESVALNDQNGSTIARRGADRFAQVGPPHLPLVDYHSTRSSARRAAARANPSGSVPTASTTSLIALVT